MIRRTLLSAVGAGTLLLSALAAGRTRRGRRPRPARQASLRRLRDADRGELLREGARERQGRRAGQHHPGRDGQDAGPAQGRLQARPAPAPAVARWPSWTPTATRTWPPTSRRTAPTRPARLHHGQRLPEDHRPERRHQPAALQHRLGREQALDVDAVSAICPDCKILVVQAKSASIADLGTAVNTAVEAGRRGRDLQQLRRRRRCPTRRTAPTTTTRASPSPPRPVTTATRAAASRRPRPTSRPSAARRSRRVGNTRGWNETAWSGAGSGCSTLNTALAAAVGLRHRLRQARDRRRLGRGRPVQRRHGGLLPDQPGRLHLGAVRRHQRVGADHRRRSTRCPATPPATPTPSPYSHTGEPVRRDQRQQRHLPDDPVVQRPHRLGRPDRPRHPERHRRLLSHPAPARHPLTPSDRPAPAGRSSVA